MDRMTALQIKMLEALIKQQQVNKEKGDVEIDILTEKIKYLSLTENGLHCAGHSKQETKNES